MKAKTTSVLLIVILFACQPDTTDSAEASNNTNWSNYAIGVPEIQELVLIAIALTPTGITDSNMVKHKGEYYQEMMDHFGKYKNEPLIEKLENTLPNSYVYIKMDACFYSFDQQGQMVKNPKRDLLNWKYRNRIEPMLNDLKVFATKTNFRQFYLDHKEYYEEQISLLDQQTPVDRQWQWLEERFPERYDSYSITFSPLVNGTHSTNSILTNDFKETHMFIAGPIVSNRYTEKVKEGLMTRVLFTEIDHNYVNPISSKFKNEIGSIFFERSIWTDQGPWSDYYPTPLLVFNEYMTWAVFSLYVTDNYDPKSSKIILEKLETQMEGRRGFPKFSAFNRQLLKLYKKQKPDQVEELYPDILKWCEDQVKK